MTDIVGLGTALIENTSDVGNNVVDNASNSFNTVITTIFTPLNNLTKGVGDAIASINPNLILIIGGIAGALFLLNKK